MSNCIQPVIIGVIRNNDKFLLTKRKQSRSESHDKWQFPGGGLEYKEEIGDCIIREIKEETGLDVTTCKLIPQIFPVIRRNWHGILIPYLCEIKNVNRPIELDHEASDYGWFTIEEIKSLDVLGYTIEIAEEAEKL